jgi:hypothetical protein
MRYMSHPVFRQFVSTKKIAAKDFRYNRRPVIHSGSDASATRRPIASATTAGIDRHSPGNATYASVSEEAFRNTTQRATESAREEDAGETSVFTPTPTASSGSSSSSSSSSSSASASASAFPPIANIIPDRILQSNWIESLDFSAFDEILFFQECGVSIDYGASLGQRLAAAYECLAPTPSNLRSALSIEGLNQNKLLFFRRLLAALQHDGVAPEELDPDFAQVLFTRWFLSLASPPSANGNGGFDAFPLQSFLLTSTHGVHADAAACKTAMPRPNSLQPQRLNATIADVFGRENPSLAPAAQKWILTSLLAVFEPTLVRPDLPAHLRYGDFEWALLGIGMRLLGEQHWRYTHNDLVALAVAVDVFQETAGDASIDEDGIDSGARDLVEQTIGIVLRMAHAAGAIDLREDDAGVSTDVTATLQTAIELFKNRMAIRRREDAGIAGDLPTRRDTAAAILKENGFHPKQYVTLTRKSGYGRDLLGSRQEDLPGLDYGRYYQLTDVLMADGMTQLLIYGGLSKSMGNALQAKKSALSHAALNARFERDFNAAFNAFSDNVMARVIAANVAGMDQLDVDFWRCANATVRIPEVSILTRVKPKANMGATGVGRPITVRHKDYKATNGLLVQLTQNNGESLHYCVILEPLAITRYTESDAVLLSKKFADFFKVDLGESLMSLNPNKPVGYQTFTNTGALSNTQFVTRKLLTPGLAPARKLAFQMTAPEASRDRMHQSLMNLLPLRACIKAIIEKDLDDAVFFCGIDALSVIPLFGSGIKVAGGVARVAAAITARQSRKLVMSLLTGVVKRELAPQVISATLQVGKPLLGFGKCALHWLNPLHGTVSGLAWLSARLADGGRRLLAHLNKVPALHLLANDLASISKKRQTIYQDRGFWRAEAGAVTEQNGQRQLQWGSRRYLTIDMGDQKNVLALQQGMDLRLVNPESGRVYGPALKNAGDQAGLRRSIPYALRRACRKQNAIRSKRGIDDDGMYTDACSGILQAAHFGRGFYSFSERHPFRAVQLRAAGAGTHKALSLRVDLNDIGFASYSILERKGEQYPVHNSRYFAFNEEIWIAENGYLEAASIACPYPERISASVVRSSSEIPLIANQAADFLRFDIELPAIDDDPTIYFNHFVVPYANYPGVDGSCMGMIEMPGVSYKFYIGRNWLMRLPAGKSIILVKATQKDYDVFEKYQQINTDVRAANDGFASSGLRQLRYCDDAVQHRFDLVLQRAEELARDADRALKSHTLAAEMVLHRFMPAYWTMARKASFIVALGANLDRLRSALPMLRRNKLDVLGLGKSNRKITMVHGEQEAIEYVRAEALSGSMTVDDMEFTHIVQPLIIFDEEHFLKMKIDTLAADELHELSHARSRTRDTISAASDVLVYPSLLGEDLDVIDIAPLLTAAAGSDSDSVNHASTLEHLLVALAYTESPETLVLLENLFNGGTRYSHRPDAKVKKCEKNCVILR